MKNYWKQIKPKLLFTLSGLLVLSSSLCGGCSNMTDETAARKYIAVICKSTDEFWDSSKMGAMDAGEELDVDITFEGPETEMEIDVQIQLVEKAIKNHADAIVLAPLDTDQLNPAIDKAVDAGIPVLTFDSDVTTKKRSATLGTNNINAGAIAARNAADLIGGTGKIAIIAPVKAAQTTIQREKGFRDSIKQEYKDNIEIVGTKYCNGDPKIAKEQTMEFLQQDPEIQCIYGANQGSAVGAARAIKEMKLQGKVKIVGFDSSDEEISYLEDGIIDGMMVQNPYNMGYLGVRNAYKLLQKKTIEEKIDTGATYVNRETLNDEDTQWLLYPLGKKE